MNLRAPVDLYCERLDPGLWAEPLNTLSNLAFFVAAWLLWRRAGSVADRCLALLVALVGAGSFLFHLYAEVWTRWIDLLLIEAFIYVYVGLYARRIFAARETGIAAVLIAYAAFEWALVGSFEAGAFNGSHAYFPALFALSLMSALAWRRDPAAARLIAAAAGIFLVAIALRSFDIAWCAVWPRGTHFIWHMLNAAVLYFSARGLRRRAL